MKVLLVGANGYGVNFVKSIFALHNEGKLTFEGVVTRSAFPMQEELAEAGIPAYKTLDAFYAERTADLALISTPAFLHREQSILCLEHGSYVLCEKPAAPTIEDVEAMLQAEKDTGKFIAIGFQRCFSEAVINLKKDIMNGVLGKPVSMKFMVLGHRNFAYYARGGGYAGQVCTKDGRIILDSPASNACAHYVQEMLFLLGDQLDVSAEPTLVKGECLRANDITNFDTCTIQLTAGDNVLVLLVASHAVAPTPRGPLTQRYTFENAVVTTEGKDLIATFKDGTVKNYGDPFVDQFSVKILHCLDAIKNNTNPVCTVKTAFPHVKMVDAIYRNIPVAEFAESEKVYTEESVYVPDLRDKLIEAFEKECMLSEV